MSKRTILVGFLVISAIVALLALEVHLLDRRRPPAIAGGFVKQPGGILDRETGLLWTLPVLESKSRKPEAPVMNRKAARKICAGETRGGRKDWRLPTAEELRHIAHCGPKLKRCAVVLTREQKAVCLRRRPGHPSWSFWTGDPERRCRDAKGRRPMCARAVRIYRGDCGEFGAVTGMRSIASSLRVICVRSDKQGTIQLQ